MSSSFELNLNQLVATVLRKLGVLAQGDDPTPEQQEEAAQALNLTLKAFQNDGVYIWTFEDYNIMTADGVEVYVLPEDTLDIMNIRLRANLFDYPIRIVNRTEWANIPDRPKMKRLWLPQMAFFDAKVQTIGTMTGPTLSLYFLPDGAYPLFFQRIRKIADMVDGTDTPDVYQRWYDALIYGAAARLADEYSLELPRCQWLQNKADHYLKIARGGNRDRSNSRLLGRAYS